jgi:hypothetical protein
MEFYRGPIDQKRQPRPNVGASLSEASTRRIEPRDSSAPLNGSESKTTEGHRLAEMQASIAAANLREFYKSLGVDDDSIQQLYKDQTHGRKDIPLTRSTAKFLEKAATIVETVPVEKIREASEANAFTRAQNYEIYVAKEAARHGSDRT